MSSLTSTRTRRPHSQRPRDLYSSSSCTPLKGAVCSVATWYSLRILSSMRATQADQVFMVLDWRQAQWKAPRHRSAHGRRPRIYSIDFHSYDVVACTPLSQSMQSPGSVPPWTFRHTEKKETRTKVENALTVAAGSPASPSARSFPSRVACLRSRGRSSLLPMLDPQQKASRDLRAIHCCKR